MAVWGVMDVDGKSAQILPDLLNPLGLECWGGLSDDKKYHVTNKDRSFDMYFSDETIKNIKKIHKVWLRKEKMKKIYNAG